jgi:hypothetical protein
MEVRFYKLFVDVDDSRVIISPTELKMQPTIHLKRKAGLWVAFSILSGSLLLVNHLVGM